MVMMQCGAARTVTMCQGFHVTIAGLDDPIRSHSSILQ